ncbi:hypothetical protein NHQ30_003945 [Ciborinia camelliae]|nr:hypothetical protein NHQ30_003945 [Ciborinia camelliae]
MLTMLRASSKSGNGSDTTEEIVRDGYPYYFKKSNGRMVMARKIPGRRGNKNFSLLGQAFGIDEPKRRSSVENLRKKKKKPVQYLTQAQTPSSVPLPQQPFPNFPPPIPFSPIIPQQSFPDPHGFVPVNSGFPPFYPLPGFPPPPVPVEQQPMRWTFQPKSTAPPSVEELLKVESDFLKRAKLKSKSKSKSRRRDGDHDDHTEIKTTTTTTITKHICARCRRDRSVKYHLDHPIRAGETPTPGFCRKCRRDATSTSGSNGDDSDDGGSTKHEDGGREREKKKNDRCRPTSRLHSVDVLSRDERSDNGRFNDYQDGIFTEQEVVRERKTAPKNQARRSDNNSRGSASRSYTRTREKDLADDDSTPKAEPKVRINTTNRTSSAAPPSPIYSSQEKSVHFDQPVGRPSKSKAASAQDLHDEFRYVEPLRSATSYASMSRSARFSRESLPSLHTRDHAQRRRTERAYPERTYDHDTRQQAYENLPRYRPDEDIIVVETDREQPKSRVDSSGHPHTRPGSSDEDIIAVKTEREQPNSRAESSRHPRPPPPPSRSSDEDYIIVETEHEYPRFRTESRDEPRRSQERHRGPARAPVRTRETYTTTQVDQHGNKMQFTWTASSSNSSPPQGFIPSDRHSSDSSEEYHRALAMARQNIPDPQRHRRSRNSFKGSGGFMDGPYTPPQVPDPPTLNGIWEPRNTGRSARATQSRGRGRSPSQSSVFRVPQHQSTARGNFQPWMNASSIDQFGQRREQNYQSRARSSTSDSGSPVSLVTHSDSPRTPSVSETQFESDSNPTPQSMVPRPASVQDTTDSGNEIGPPRSASTSPKATVEKKLTDVSRHHHHGHLEATNSRATDKDHANGTASQKYNNQLGSYASYVEYGDAMVIPNETIHSNINARVEDVADDYDNTTILDDATDLTLRTARSKAAMNERINARRRVSFAQMPQFVPTPEKPWENTWGNNTNANTNGDQSWSANTDGDNSWGANTTSNDFWSPNTSAESVLPDVGGYSGPPSANASKVNLNNDPNTGGFDYTKGFAPTPTNAKSQDATGTGGDGNDDRGEDTEQKVDDEWGPIPTFSTLNI